MQTIRHEDVLKEIILAIGAIRDDAYAIKRAKAWLRVAELQARIDEHGIAAEHGFDCDHVRKLEAELAEALKVANG